MNKHVFEFWHPEDEDHMWVASTDIEVARVCAAVLGCQPWPAHRIIPNMFLRDSPRYCGHRVQDATEEELYKAGVNVVLP